MQTRTCPITLTRLKDAATGLGPSLLADAICHPPCLGVSAGLDSGSQGCIGCSPILFTASRARPHFPSPMVWHSNKVPGKKLLAFTGSRAVNCQGDKPGQHREMPGAGERSGTVLNVYGGVWLPGLHLAKCLMGAFPLLESQGYLEGTHLQGVR